MTFTKELWESLTSAPGWGAMRQYLMDFRAKLAEQVLSGNLEGKELSEAIFRCQDLKDIAEMDWPTVAKFYSISIVPDEDKKRDQP